VTPETLAQATCRHLNSAQLSTGRQKVGQKFSSGDRALAQAAALGR
jgi:hypothetical protein